jgi:DNA-directed RNA polymerase specialized sigma24 family protein
MTDDESRVWHERALSGDPSVPGALWELLHAQLRGDLTRDGRFRRLDPADVSDAVTDVILAYTEKPATYNPDKCSLDRFFRMAAARDLYNLIAKAKRRPRVDSLDVVAVDLEDGNSERDMTSADGRLEAWLSRRKGQTTLPEKLRELLPDPRDRMVLLLMVDRERRTEVYARALGCLDCPIEEQRKRVKQTKDRIRIALKRKGIRLHAQI